MKFLHSAKLKVYYDRVSFPDTDTEMCTLYTSRLKIKTSYNILEDIILKSPTLNL